MNISHGRIDPKRVFCVIDKYKLFPISSMIDSLKENPNKNK